MGPLTTACGRRQCSVAAGWVAQGEGRMVETGVKGLRGAAERAVRRLAHTYWRLARGMTLGVRAIAIDDAGRARGSGRADSTIHGSHCRPGRPCLPAT